jgi:hypothetical protein
MTAPSDKPASMSAESTRERAAATLWLIHGQEATEQIRVMADMVAAGEADAYQAGYAAGAEAEREVCLDDLRIAKRLLAPGEDSARKWLSEVYLKIDARAKGGV